MEFEVQNGRFWLLENRGKENEIQRFIYDDPKPAIERLKELMKDINTDKLLLSTVDVTEKGWNITSTPWAIIAMGIVRGDISDEIMRSLSQSQLEATKKK